MAIFVSKISIILTAIVTLFFLYTSPIFAYPVTISWEAPTKNADGTPLTDLQGFRIYYGTSSRNYSHSIDVGNVTIYTANNATDGVIYYVAVTAYDSLGNESDYSNEVSIALYTINIIKDGSGNGTVDSSPAGINCGYSCSSLHKDGTVVTLTAIPDEGSTFTGWSGSGCTGEGRCVLTLNGNATIEAHFEAITSVIVTSPNGGETLISSTKRLIRWSTNSTLSPASAVLGYSLDGGISWELITTLWENPGLYEWTVPAVPGETATCRVGVRLKDASGNILADDKSDRNFTIKQ